MHINSIYIRKRNKVILPKAQNSSNKKLVAAVLWNFKGLGYTFSLKLAQRLVTLTPSKISEFYQSTFPTLKELKGVKHYVPLYSNFPVEVEYKEVDELIMDALEYAVSDFTIPEKEKILRPSIDELTKLTAIDLGTPTDFDTIFQELVGAKTSISSEDKEIVLWFIKNHKDITKLLPDTIPLKENVALVVGGLLEHNGSVSNATKYLKTPTDVVRLCVQISGGDVSLAEPCKFINFKRSFRRGILAILEKMQGLEEGMVKYKEIWVRLGEKLHPGEFATRFPKVYQAFKKLREHKKIATFNSNVEQSIKQGTIRDAVQSLKNRPGEFARRMDHLIRSSTEWERVLVAEEFLKVAQEVSLPVLLQVYTHFKTRNKRTERAVFPKGSMSKIQVIPNPKNIEGEFTEALARDIRKEIIKALSKRDKLGKVYVDPCLEKYNIPFAERSASKALQTIVRGSRVPLQEEKNTIRFFIWWKQSGSKNEDIDLSASVLTEDWTYHSDLSYYNLRGSYGYHSGDIRSAPRGASEFIDINMERVLEEGGRYIVMSIYSYTGTPFIQLPECLAGWMLRDKPNSGEIYEPQTVQNRFDVSVDTLSAVPLIIDLVTKEVIWVDIGMKNRIHCNAAGSSNKMIKICKAISTMHKPNLKDLFDMHVEARGERAEREEADLIISPYEGLTPQQQGAIISEWL